MKFLIKKTLDIQDKNLEAILSDILSKLQILFETRTAPFIILEPLNKEPDKKVNGMIVYFNNVGGKTGFYGYENGSWVKL